MPKPIAVQARAGGGLNFNKAAVAAPSVFSSATTDLHSLSRLKYTLAGPMPPYAPAPGGRTNASFWDNGVEG
jgi:hypothetical protein